MERPAKNIISLALAEDLGDIGDITSQLLLDSSKKGEAVIIAKQIGILAGLNIVEQVFKKIDPALVITKLLNDGARVTNNTEILIIKGTVASILSAERTALNFLQRLSGIATLTSLFVEKIRGTKAKILDTRKTTPGLRHLEKYAVRVGGGQNHRIGLYDMVLIKENHLAVAGGITNAVNQIKQSMRNENHDFKIEVEASSIEQVKEALTSNIDRVMLDNMSFSQIRKCVNLIDGRLETEVSGNVTLDSVREIAETGVDYISVGALTHSAKALDMSLLIRHY